MPFNGDEFTRLGLPPYSGPLAAEFQNLADGLTLLKGETVIIDNETVKIAIGGHAGRRAKSSSTLATTSLVWRDDNVGTRWRAAGKRTYRPIGTSTDTTSDAFVQNKPGAVDDILCGLSPGYGIPTYDEPHLSNIHGTPTDGQAVVYDLQTIGWSSPR